MFVYRLQVEHHTTTFSQNNKNTFIVTFQSIVNILVCILGFCSSTSSFILQSRLLIHSFTSPVCSLWFSATPLAIRQPLPQHLHSPASLCAFAGLLCFFPLQFLHCMPPDFFWFQFSCFLTLHVSIDSPPVWPFWLFFKRCPLPGAC